MKYAALLALLLLFLTAACSAPAEWVREYPGYLPGADSENMVVLSVRDAETGAPIAGARVRPHTEGWPTDEGEWAGVLAERTTDQYGLAWFPAGDIPGAFHWAVHADGYAPTEVIGRFPDHPVLLHRGTSYHGRILDPLGAPLQGARVDFIGGCPHAPALDRVETDATGRFVFARAWLGSFPMTHPDVEAAYHVPARRIDLPPPVFVTLPTRPIEGRLLRADGTVVGAGVVHNSVSPRGPLARVGADGRFTIRGGRVGARQFAYLDKMVEIPAGWFPGSNPFTFVVDAEEEYSTRTIFVRTEGARRVWLVLIRKRDGKRFSVQSDTEVAVPAGAYRVQTWPRFTRFAGVGDLPPDGRMTLALTEQPRLVVACEGEDVRMRIMLDDTWEEIEEPLYLPVGARAVVLAEAGGARVWAPVGPAKDSRRVATVRLPPRKTIRLPDCDGVFDLHGEESWRDSDFEVDGELVTLRATGRVVAEYVGAESGTEIRAEFDLPATATGVIEPIRVEHFELDADVAVHLLLPNGSPAIASEVWFNGEQSMADDDGIAWVPGARDGTRLSLVQQSSSFAAHHVTLHGSGPYTVQWGACSLRFAIPGVAKPLVWLDGAVRKLRKDLILEGLAEGPHTLIIGAPGRKHSVMRVVLEAGETRVIDLALPRRSSPR